jgi:hypothetical protein
MWQTFSLSKPSKTTPAFRMPGSIATTTSSVADERRIERLLLDATLEVRVDQPADIHEVAELARAAPQVAHVAQRQLDGLLVEHRIVVDRALHDRDMRALALLPHLTTT